MKSLWLGVALILINGCHYSAQHEIEDPIEPRLTVTFEERHTPGFAVENRYGKVDSLYYEYVHTNLPTRRYDTLTRTEYKALLSALDMGSVMLMDSTIYYPIDSSRTTCFIYRIKLGSKEKTILTNERVPTKFPDHFQRFCDTLLHTIQWRDF